ncbi:MAG: RNA polymerase sigma factor [Planctomycetota bacterium]
MTNDQQPRPPKDAPISASPSSSPGDGRSRGATDQVWTEAAMRTVLETHEAGLIRYTTRLLHGDVERAREVVQDSFLRLCRVAPGEVDSHLTEWLYTVCRNRARDVARKERRMTAFTDRESPANEEAIDARIAGRGSDGSAPPIVERTPGQASATLVNNTSDHRHGVGEGDEVQRQILNMLGTLSPNQQEVIRLKFQGGLTYRQISSVTELSVSNVGFLIHTGLKRLREQMHHREAVPAVAGASSATQRTPSAGDASRAAASSEARPS